MNRSPLQPRLADLTAGFLTRAEDAEVLAAAADAFGEVQPHEVAVGFRAEPRAAWAAGFEAMTAAGQTAPLLMAPADWGTLVARHDAVAALPFAVGNYPQRVRDLGTLFMTEKVGSLLPKTVESAEATPGLQKWAAKQAGETATALVAAATVRSARDFDRAAELLAGIDANADWKPVVANESAAMMWQRGEYAKAEAAWAELPDSIPVRFNRGMAALFLGRSPEAVPHLKAAVAGLPEASAWHHLASLYLTLAEMKK
jgi:hypothetical protein